MVTCTLSMKWRKSYIFFKFDGSLINQMSSLSNFSANLLFLKASSCKSIGIHIQFICIFMQLSQPLLQIVCSFPIQEHSRMAEETADKKSITLLFIKHHWNSNYVAMGIHKRAQTHFNDNENLLYGTKKKKEKHSCLVAYLFLVELSDTFPIVSRLWLLDALWLPDILSAHPTYRFWTIRIDHCSQPTGHWLFVYFLFVFRVNGYIKCRTVRKLFFFHRYWDLYTNVSE